MSLYNIKHIFGYCTLFVTSSHVAHNVHVNYSTVNVNLSTLLLISFFSFLSFVTISVYKLDSLFCTPIEALLSLTVCLLPNFLNAIFLKYDE